MLRSRRKALEKKAKKSNDASARQISVASDNTDSTFTVKSQNDIVVASITESSYRPDVIDPTQIRHANQVDKWAKMIDSMALDGRLRQLAIHATVDLLSTEESLVLNLDQATKHLLTENATQQLEQKLSQLLTKKIKVEINIVGETNADPYQIQNQINDKRYQYAKELLAQDEIVQTLQQDYQATIDESSIKAL